MLILTASLVLVFGYFGIDKFLNPTIWIGWIPAWMDGLLGLSVYTWLNIIGVTELLLAFLLVIPVRRVRQAGVILICLHLIGILTQVGWNDIGVRDLGLLGAALGLLFLI